MDQLVETYLQRIKEVFPQEIEAFKIHQGGDDYILIEVDHAWMFRFPRSEMSQKAMEIETNFLDEFRTNSPLAVPARSYIEENFVGYQKIQGAPLSFGTFASLPKPTRDRIAEQLGGFLSAIHNFPIEKADGIGITHAWNGLHHESGKYFLEHVASRLSAMARKKSVPLMERLLAEEFEGKVIHGDFYLPDHVFYDENKQELSGVIDFGDVTVYDPAHDWQCILEVGGDELVEAVMKYYQVETDGKLVERSKMRLDARPLFVAGYMFLHGIEEQYAERLARIEDRSR
jgi:aminoglycoside 2''-phosphotransferase